MGAAQQRPRGFTLVELLLVLALMVLLVAWIAPEWRGQLAAGRLESAAKELRGVLEEARLRAIEDGNEYVVEIVPGTGRYRVREAAEEDETIEDALQVSPKAAEQPGGHVPWKVESALPEGVRLAEAADQSQPRGSVPPDEKASTSDDGSPAEEAWVAWAVFYPQGTASNGELFLEDDRREERWQLTLRGLVGRAMIADVSQVEARDE